MENHIFESQSGMHHEINEQETSSPTSENVDFVDHQEHYKIAVETTEDPTRMMQDSDDATLQNFFSRPIKIFEEEWDVGSRFDHTFNPWTLFWENPRVSNRICNFNLLRCKMHLKVVINGNGFYYGRAMMGYLPASFYDSVSVFPASDLGIVRLSQLPHVFLNPTESSGGEMVLPFYYWENSFKIPDGDWRKMGECTIRSFHNLQHANGDTTPVTVTIFAWAEDVSMSVLTNIEPTGFSNQSGEAFAPQMGEIDEANQKGFISGPATAVSKVASALKDVPVIGPFAKATETAANIVGSVAKLFGFSRPSVTKNPEPYRPTICSSLACTTTPDTALKLTVDDKQELSIDTRIAGLDGTDQMSILNIATKEAYLGSFNWTTSNASGSLLWNMRVSPMMWREDASGGHYLLPCCFAALPFQFWTGTMRIRFQIVSSAYHKGRIKLQYDPNMFLTDEYNTNYVRIVDIASETDFTVEIANSQNKSLLSHAYPGVTSAGNMYGTLPLFSSDEDNGLLRVSVVNRLTTPSPSGNDLRVNVFVSAGDDFETFVPEGFFQNFVFESQMGFESQSGTTPDSHATAELDSQQHRNVYKLGIAPKHSEHLNCVYAGESIASFRTLLKRYNKWLTLGQQNNSLSARFSVMPYYRGAVPGAVDNSSTTPYNYCNTVLLHWVKTAFSGWRGSIRYKLIPRGGSYDSDYISVERYPLSVSGTKYQWSDTNIAPITGKNAIRRSGVNSYDRYGDPVALDHPRTGVPGQALTVGKINGCLEVEIPYYSNYRFTPGKTINETGLVIFESGWSLQTYRPSLSGGEYYDVHVAAGEDFQTYFFTGLPPVYYEGSIPPSV